MPFSDDSHKVFHDLEMQCTDLQIGPKCKEAKRKEIKGEKKAMDWSAFLSEEAAARRPSALKAAFRHLTIPGIISLGGGLPLPAYFPFHDVSCTVPTLGKWSEEETATEGTSINIVKYPHKQQKSMAKLTNYHTRNCQLNRIPLRSMEVMPTVGLSTTLQYGLGTGDPCLVNFLKQHTEMVHNPPYSDWDTTLTCGNTYSFYACLRMLLERGDYLVMEEYTYSSAISTCGPMGIRIVAVEMDEEGMIPEMLDQMLSSWDDQIRGARKPRVVYLVPYFHLQWRLTVALDKIQQGHQCLVNGGMQFTQYVKSTISSLWRTSLITSSKWTHITHPRGMPLTS